MHPEGGNPVRCMRLRFAAWLSSMGGMQSICLPDVARWSVGFVMAAGLAFAVPGRAGDFACTAGKYSTTISGYTGAGGMVAIPSAIGGLPVVAIDDLAFNQCASLTGVAIPAGIGRIGGSAFDACSGLATIEVDPANRVYSSVDGVLFDRGVTSLLLCPAARTGAYRVPGTVTNIAYGAFYGCSRLSAIWVPPSVTRIGDWAFYECAGATNITIGNAKAVIGDKAFYHCTNLRTLIVGTNVVASVVAPAAPPKSIPSRHKGHRP